MIRKKTAYRLRTVQPWPFHVSLPRNSKWWHLMCVGFIQYSLIFFLSSSLFYARMHISRHCILISNSRVDVRMICVCDRDFFWFDERDIYTKYSNLYSAFVIFCVCCLYVHFHSTWLMGLSDLVVCLILAFFSHSLCILLYRFCLLMNGNCGDFSERMQSVRD